MATTRLTLQPLRALPPTKLRFERIKEKAIEFAFLLKATGQDGMKPLEGTGTGLKKGAAKKTAKAIEAEEEVDAME